MIWRVGHESLDLFAHVANRDGMMSRDDMVEFARSGRPAPRVIVDDLSVLPMPDLPYAGTGLVAYRSGVDERLAAIVRDACVGVVAEGSSPYWIGTPSTEYDGFDRRRSEFDGFRGQRRIKRLHRLVVDARSIGPSHLFRLRGEPAVSLAIFASQTFVDTYQETGSSGLRFVPVAS